jgi:hypothetical protein
LEVVSTHSAVEIKVAVLPGSLAAAGAEVTAHGRHVADVYGAVKIRVTQAGIDEVQPVGPV